jgi:hypothetical protein
MAESPKRIIQVIAVDCLARMGSVGEQKAHRDRRNEKRPGEFDRAARKTVHVALNRDMQLP